MSARSASDACTSGRARSAAPLPQPQAEVEQRAQAEIGEHEGVPGLRRAVRRDHETGCRGREPGGHERGGACDEAVEEDDAALGGRAEADAGQDRKLEATHGREHANGIGRVHRVDRERTAHGLDLPGEPGVVEPGTTPAHRLGIRGEERRTERGGRGGVADAHVAGRDDPAPARGELRGDLRSAPEPRKGLVGRHRRALRGIRRPGPEPELADCLVLHGSRDAGVHDDKLRPGLAGEDVHRCAPGGEVGEHLARDLLRVRAHLPGRVAVVSGREHDSRPEPARRGRSPDRSHTARQRLQLAEAPARLRLAVERALRGPAGCPVDRLDAPDDGVEGGPAHVSSSVRPATIRYACSASAAKTALTLPSRSR